MNMKSIKLAAFAMIMGVVSFIGIRASMAAVPWAGAGTAVPTAGLATASPLCTTFAFAPVCIIKMGANLTSLSISGDPGTATNHQATIVMEQDGTGGRVFPSAISSFTGTLPSPASTAANKYTAYVLSYSTTTNLFTVVGQYDNYPLGPSNFTYKDSQAEAGATVGPTAAVALPTVQAPGMTANNSCLCVPNQTTNAITVSCLPQTNALQCQLVNATGGTITATSATMNIRELP